MTSEHPDRMSGARRPALWVWVVSLAGVAVQGLAYWVAVAGKEPLMLSILYRYGDHDYLPLVFGLSRGVVREFTVFESLGVNAVTFPLAAVAPWALGVAVFGPVGFIVVDFVIALLRWLVATALLAPIVRNRSAAMLTAVCLIWLWGPYGHRYSPLQSLWTYRYPRPYWTVVLLLIGVFLLSRVWDEVIDRAPPRWSFATFGFAVGVLVQGDLHGAIVLVIGAGLLAVAGGVRTRRIDPRWLQAAGAFGLCALPFLVQVLYASPDALRRLGQFPMNRWSPPVLVDPAASLWMITLASPVFVVLAMTRTKAFGIGDAVSPSARSLFTTLAAVLVASHLALPVSTVVLGRGVQLYHFGYRALILSKLALALGSIAIVGTMIRVLARRRQKAIDRWARPVGAAMVALCFLAFVPRAWSYANERVATHAQPRVYRNAGWEPIDGYRGAMADLIQELGHREYDGARVLGAFDQELLQWWSAARAGQIYSPDPFVTTLSDDAIEQRVAELSRFVNMDEAQFARHLDDAFFVENFVAAAKFQASAAYTYAPLSQYTAEEQARIAASSYFDNWQLIVPREDRRRLLARFRGANSLSSRLDLVVIVQSTDYPDLYVEDPDFVRTYSNSVFTVYRRTFLPRAQ